MLRAIGGRFRAWILLALQALMQYSWPGNVREFEHTMERAVLMCRTDQIQPADLGLGVARPQAQNLEELSLESVETILIRKALQRFQGNVSQAAEALGLSRGALYRRMEKYGLSPGASNSSKCDSLKPHRSPFARRVTRFTALLVTPGC